MRISWRSLAVDFSASIAVYLVALPLCLGVAVASDANPIAGIIAGIVGGIVIGILSKSPLSVSGPAAGLTAIVAAAIGMLPSYEVFMVSVVIAGMFQLLFGFLKAGQIADLIPNAVIKGMLAAIGLILIFKQIPYFLGYHEYPGGDESFIQTTQKNFYTGFIEALLHPDTGASIIGLSALSILLLFEHKRVKSRPLFRFFPAALMAVLAGILLNHFFSICQKTWQLKGDHLVALPVFEKPNLLISSLSFPDWKEWTHPQVWETAITLAIVASLETLLSIEAVDRIDPERRTTPTNQELKAQGVGNIVSGLLGGLPVTSVIVRSSANVNAGAYSKLSTIIHGFLICISLLFFPKWLNMIPLSCLAAVLLLTGYKLAKPALFISMKQKGWIQFSLFLTTVLAILLTDMLKGILVGIIVGLIILVRSNFKRAIFIIRKENGYLIQFSKKVSFLNKGIIKRALADIPKNTYVLLDVTKSDYIDPDIIESVDDFIASAEQQGIRVEVQYNAGKTKPFFNQSLQKGSILI